MISSFSIGKHFKTEFKELQKEQNMAITFNIMSSLKNSSFSSNNVEEVNMKNMLFDYCFVIFSYMKRFCVVRTLKALRNL